MKDTVGYTVPPGVRNGKVLVVGVGGLGCPAALALARAGVGTIGLVDPDVVELSNLQRQILHATPDLGRPKVHSAREKLLRINPALSVVPYQERLGEENLSELFQPYDFIIDGTDGIATKFLINDGAVLMQRPFSYAGAVQFQGQTMTILPRKSTCLRCWFPLPPAEDEVPTCQESGVLGSLVGSIGVIQATEAVKYLSGEGDLLIDRLLTYNALTLRWREIRVQRSRHCPLCGEAPSITSLHSAVQTQETVCSRRDAETKDDRGADMSNVTGLTCRECGQEYPIAPLHVCEMCFGPLEVVYDYESIRKQLSRRVIESRPQSLWRYRELLPVNGEPRVGLHSGFTPLVKADRLAAHLGVKELYVKDDSVNHPTFSYKDRVVSVAISKAIEFGFDTVSCASTGNLANSVSAHAARAGLRCFIFIPADLEQGKIIGSTVYGPRAVSIRGNYDDVNRLCSEIADKYGWAFVNINLRPYYTEGAKTYGFEIAEQLGWRLPQHIIVPTAGGTILPKVAKAFEEMKKVGLIDDPYTPKIYTAQAAGCAPVIHALHKGSDLIVPVKPNTIAKSIAIGNPADGYYVLRAVRDSGGWGEAVTDQEIVEAIQLLAQTEGIFTEPAGGTTVAVAKKLIEQGRIPRNESIVISITGNGYKTIEAVMGHVNQPFTINARLQDFDSLYQSLTPPAASSVPAAELH